jgi:hypothetical protein
MKCCSANNVLMRLRFCQRSAQQKPVLCEPAFLFLLHPGLWLRHRTVCALLCKTACGLTSNPLHCAEMRICDLRRPGLSADDRRIAVLNSAFEAKTGFSAVFLPLT